MKYITLTYSMGNQQTFEPFKMDLKGLKQALRAITKREKNGWKCEPERNELERLIEKAK